MNIEQNSPRVQAYNLTKLAHIYGVSSRTMRRWLEPHAPFIGLRIGRFYTPLQIEIIFSKLGLPGKSKNN